MRDIKRFVAWGHKLHTHTHSYIYTLHSRRHLTTLDMKHCGLILLGHYFSQRDR